MEAPKETCPICLENISTAASVVQPCSHAFCLECITKWTDQNPTCPLCLKTIDTICKRCKAEEDIKEQTIELKVSPKASNKSTDEDFDCFGHDYFVNEFRALFKQVQETEFSLKSQIGIKKKALHLEKNYQLVLHMKQEIEMKLNFLARVQKISPKDLLGDIQHFCDILRNVNGSKEVVHYDNDFAYGDDAYYEDDYYGEEEVEHDHYSMYSAAVTKVAKTKKKSKNKGKNKKDDLGQENNLLMFS